MRYRDLGLTGLQVSAIGLGCDRLRSSTADYAAKVGGRALELGVTYFDTARGYWNSEVKLGLAREGERSKVVILSKTAAKTREVAWREVNESLERLRTDCFDNYHLQGLWPGEDLERRLGPGGALEAFARARDEASPVTSAAPATSGWSSSRISSSTPSRSFSCR
jgi:hypothetical protein